ncbi:D-xylose ABC transporter substrate-binding protein [Alicyclobacillus contaminans]|nr:D-xylose ABC transporter substrate-binding protein [Alicyclobacillus contaminans]
MTAGMAAMLALAAAGCGTSGGSGNSAGSGGSGGNGVKIGLSFGDLQLERWHHDEQYFTDYVKANSKDQVLVQDANGDSSTQVSQCENLISQGVKVLVIVPQDGTALTQVVNDANRSGVKVIAYDRMIVNAKPDLYVSFDNVKVGELQAQYLTKVAPKGKYVLIEGSPTDNNAYMFYQGQMNVLQPLIDKGDIQVVFKQFTPNWSTENALNEMEDALTKTHNQVDAVLDANDSTALGVIQALKQQHLAGKVPVTGQDADLANCQLIEQGLQTMTVYKPIKQEAEAAAKAAIELGNGQMPQTTATTNNKTINVPSILLTPIAVTKDNMMSTVVKDGFHTEAEVKSTSSQ